MPFKSLAQKEKFKTLVAKGDISKETNARWEAETGDAVLPWKVNKTAEELVAQFESSKEAAKLGSRRVPTDKMVEVMHRLGGSETSIVQNLLEKGKVDRARSYMRSSLKEPHSIPLSLKDRLDSYKHWKQTGTVPEVQLQWADKIEDSTGRLGRGPGGVVRPGRAFAHARDPNVETFYSGGTDEGLKAMVAHPTSSLDKLHLLPGSLRADRQGVFLGDAEEASLYVGKSRNGGAPAMMEAAVPRSVLLDGRPTHRPEVVVPASKWKSDYVTQISGVPKQANVQDLDPSNLRPGDVLVTGAPDDSGIRAKLMRTRLYKKLRPHVQGDWTHVGMYTGDGEVVSGEMAGVQRKQLADEIADRNVRVMRPNVSDDVREKAIQHMQDAVGKPYAPPHITAGVGARILGGGDGSIMGGIADATCHPGAKGQYNCSNLIGDAFHQATGDRQFVGPAGVTLAAPGDFPRSSNFTEVGGRALRNDAPASVGRFAKSLPRRYAVPAALGLSALSVAGAGHALTKEGDYVDDLEAEAAVGATGVALATPYAAQPLFSKEVQRYTPDRPMQVYYTDPARGRGHYQQAQNLGKALEAQGVPHNLVNIEKEFASPEAHAELLENYKKRMSGELSNAEWNRHWAKFYATQLDRKGLVDHAKAGGGTITTNPGVTPWLHGSGPVNVVVPDPSDTMTKSDLGSSWLRAQDTMYVPDSAAEHYKGDHVKRVSNVPLDPDMFKPSQTPHGFDPARSHVTVSGGGTGADVGKQLEQLLAAKSQAIDGKPVMYHAMGGGMEQRSPEEWKALQDVAARHPDRVKAYGDLPQDQVRAMFGGANMNVLRPHGTMGTEATLSGKPMLLSARGGVADDGALKWAPGMNLDNAEEMGKMTGAPRGGLGGATTKANLGQVYDESVPKLDELGRGVRNAAGGLSDTATEIVQDITRNPTIKAKGRIPFARSGLALGTTLAAGAALHGLNEHRKGTLYQKKRPWHRFTKKGSRLRKAVNFTDEIYEGMAGTQRTFGMNLNGRRIGELAAIDGQVATSKIAPEFRGLGLGKKMYGEAMRRLPDQKMTSDYNVSDAASRVWKGMPERGYDMQATELPTGRMQSFDGGVGYNTAPEPIFSARLPEKAKIDTPPTPYKHPAASPGSTADFEAALAEAGITDPYLVEQVLAGLQSTGKVAATRKRKAVIIKGNPMYIRGNLQADKFYEKLKSELESRDYDVVFDAGKPFSTPPKADLWVGHSRGADRLRFATAGTKTIDLSPLETEASQKHLKERYRIAKKLDVPFHKVPLHLWTPLSDHYIVTPQMRMAFDRAYVKTAAVKVGPPPSRNRKEYPYTGVINFKGLPEILVENRKGSTRSGVGPKGKAWSTTMPAHYGEFRRTAGTDGDPVDVYIGPNDEAQTAYIVHTMKPPTFKQFDEDKVMVGFDSLADVKSTFREAYDDKRFMGSVSACSVVDLASMLKKRSVRGKKLDQTMINSKAAFVLDASVEALLKAADFSGTGTGEASPVFDALSESFPGPVERSRTEERGPGLFAAGEEE